MEKLGAVEWLTLGTSYPPAAIPNSTRLQLDSQQLPHLVKEGVPQCQLKQAPRQPGARLIGPALFLRCEMVVKGVGAAMPGRHWGN